MENKILGTILVSISIIMIILLILVRSGLVESYEARAEAAIAETGTCHRDTDTCPYEDLVSAQIPIFIGIALLAGLASLGAYIIFFEKSQKEIVSALKKERKIKSDEERFSILLKALDNEEKRVIKAVKEQDGITQQTLRLRTDMHKSKLSIVLDSMEKKNLIKRIAKGKTKQVFLKIKV